MTNFVIRLNDIYTYLTSKLFQNCAYCYNECLHVIYHNFMESQFHSRLLQTMDAPTWLWSTARNQKLTNISK